MVRVALSLAIWVSPELQALGVLFVAAQPSSSDQSKGIPLRIIL
jgi:hypothetical protein